MILKINYKSGSLTAVAVGRHRRDRSSAFAIESDFINIRPAVAPFKDVLPRERIIVADIAKR